MNTIRRRRQQQKYFLYKDSKTSYLGRYRFTEGKNSFLVIKGNRIFRSGFSSERLEKSDLFYPITEEESALLL